MYAQTPESIDMRAEIISDTIEHYIPSIFNEDESAPKALVDAKNFLSDLVLNGHYTCASFVKNDKIYIRSKELYIMYSDPNVFQQLLCRAIRELLSGKFDNVTIGESKLLDLISRREVVLNDVISAGV